MIKSGVAKLAESEFKGEEDPGRSYSKDVKIAIDNNG